MQTDYTVIIPTYNDYDNICLLLQDIAKSCKKYTPTYIYIINDGCPDLRTQHLAKRFESPLLPVIKVFEKEHTGLFDSIELGLNHVDTTHALICSSDTRLIGNHPANIFKDVLSVLAFYTGDISESNGIGLSCHSVSMPVIESKDLYPNHISKGIRALGDNGLPFTIYKQFKIEPLLLSETDKFMRVHSVDSSLFTLNMERYREINGFDKTYGYMHTLDDFFGRAMLNEYRCYFTQETFAYHSLEREKPENSLTSVESIDMLEDCKKFLLKWSKNDVWTYNFLHDHYLEDEDEDDAGSNLRLEDVTVEGLSNNE